MASTPQQSPEQLRSQLCFAAGETLCYPSVVVAAPGLTAAAAHAHAPVAAAGPGAAPAPNHYGGPGGFDAAGAGLVPRSYVPAAAAAGGGGTDLNPSAAVAAPGAATRVLRRAVAPETPVLHTAASTAAHAAASSPAALSARTGAGGFANAHALHPAAACSTKQCTGHRLWPFIHQSGGPVRCCCARNRCFRTSCIEFGNQDYGSLEGYRPEGMPAPPVFTVGMLGLLLLLQVRHLQKVVAQLLHSQHSPRRPQVRTCRSRGRSLTDQCSSSGYLDKGYIIKYQFILMVVQCEVVDVLTIHSLTQNWHF